MQNQDKPTVGSAADSDTKPGVLQRAFAVALGRELDRIGYPAAPARTNQLSQDLGLGRMQAYRIGRGDNVPTLKALLKLQCLGVSLDSVLAQLRDHLPQKDEVAVEILGVAMKATPLPAYGRTPFALSRRDGRAVLRVLKAGEALDAGDTVVGGLRFTRSQPLEAVVDDDPDDLAVLCKEIGQGFGVHPFRSGQGLLDDTTRLAEFDALVMNWRQPDIDGAALVNLVRAHTCALIIITSGVPRDAKAISQILHLQNMRYAVKSVHGSILRAMIESANAEGYVAPSVGARHSSVQPRK